VIFKQELVMPLRDFSCGVEEVYPSPYHISLLATTFLAISRQLVVWSSLWHWVSFSEVVYYFPVCLYSSHFSVFALHKKIPHSLARWRPVWD